MKPAHKMEESCFEQAPRPAEQGKESSPHPAAKSPWLHNAIKIRFKAFLRARSL